MFYSATYKAFYPAGLRNEYERAGTWPEDAVEVTADEWKTYGQGQPPAGHRRGADENGRPVWAPIPAKSIEDLATAAQRRINDGYTAALAAILDQYPDAETLSFDKQEREAREWQAWHDPAGNNGQGSEPATPYLDAMLAERPLDKADLVGRIITKANAFMTAHGNATGRRQRLEDQVNTAKEAEDRAALEALDW